jgi:hypothetical protein
MTLTASLTRCEPRWATPRTPGRRTLGAQAARIADQLGVPLMPWQQLVLDVGLELGDDGLPCYREVWVTVPRQNGKTTLILVKMLNRALLWERRGRVVPQKLMYSAQTGKDAREKILEDFVPMLKQSPMWVTVDRVLSGMGNEAVRFKTGSLLKKLESSDSSGHGKTVDDATIDEAFRDLDDRREQALIPSMSTIADAQLWGISTAGTDASVYLRRKVDVGREAVNADRRTGVAYFEWSAADDADPDDPATWWSCMPALGRTINEGVVQHARQTMTDGEFRRAYLNQWTSSAEAVISSDVWAAVQGEHKPDGRLTFALDVNPDRTAAAIAVADRDGRVELVEYRPGTSWVTARVVELVGRWSGRVALDATGPAGSLSADLEAAGVEVDRYNGGRLAAACGAFYDAVADRRVQVRPSPQLTTAVEGARRQSVGDAWRWARKDLTVDVCPLVAVTVAFDAARATPNDVPFVVYG